MNAQNITALVDAHGTDIYRFCHKLTGNKVDADDLYQETFLRALEQCHKIDENRNPKSFLLSVSIHLWKSLQRKTIRRQKLAPSVELTEADEVADPHCTEDVVIMHSVCSVIREAADELGDKHRIPLYLYYTLDMSIEEISGVLKIPTGTVKSRLHKARAVLKTRLEANLSEAESLDGATI